MLKGLQSEISLKTRAEEKSCDMDKTLAILLIVKARYTMYRVVNAIRSTSVKQKKVPQHKEKNQQYQKLSS